MGDGDKSDSAGFPGVIEGTSKVGSLVIMNCESAVNATLKKDPKRCSS